MNPISNLILYNCKLDRTMHKTIDFSSQSARDSYFSSNNSIATIISIPYSGNAYFIRENKTVKVPINADVLDANGVNYCRFNNPQSGTSNYFYCFIDNIEYAAPQTAILHLRTDVMLTNVCNYSASNCFVERQHIAKSDDVYYNQLTPESIDYGDIVEFGDQRVTADLSARDILEYDNNYWTVVCMSEQFDNSSTTNTDPFFGGVPNSCYFYAMLGAQLPYFIDEINNNGQESAIISIYPVPKSYVQTLTTDLTFYNLPVYLLYDKDYSMLSDYTIVNTAALNTMNNGYIPRNNKLLTYPYNYLKLHNNNNSEIDFKFENITDHGNLIFKSILSPTVNESLIVFPENYENYSGSYYSEYLGNYKYSVECNDFPEIPYTSDLYKNYIALNKNSLQMQKIDIRASELSGFASNTLSANIPGLIQTGISSTLDYMRFDASLNDMKNKPKQIHGNSSGSNKFMSGSFGVFVSKMSIKQLYAEKIDKYFDMYGYNISNVQIPNWTNRSHYNFVKTSGIDIYGTVAKDDKQKIAEIFDSGVTFWHISNGAVYGTYDTNNV